MQLGAAGKDRCAESHPETASQIAQQVKNPRCIAGFFIADTRKSRCRKGHEEKPKSKALDDPGQGDCPKARIQVKTRHQVQRGRTY